MKIRSGAMRDPYIMALRDPSEIMSLAKKVIPSPATGDPENILVVIR